MDYSIIDNSTCTTLKINIFTLNIRNHYEQLHMYHVRDLY